MNPVLPALLALSTLLSGAAAMAASVAPAAGPTSHLVVHEWGTFTSFQDRRGQTIGGVNVDDEPLPVFVHRGVAAAVRPANAAPAGPSSKGVPSCAPEVTLRLETPVLYFYPQPGWDPNVSIDVKAEFPGGWLTEFYPNAKAVVAGFPKRLEATDRGSLQWRGLRLIAHPTAPLSETESPVWLAPRKVRSTVVATDDEREKYLFYRGVGSLDAPLVVRQSDDTLTIKRRDSERTLTKLPPMWLVQVQPDGRVWYRTLTGQGNKAKVSVLDRGDEAGDLEGLRRKLSLALQANGLFKDEAHAMLATWQESYFASAGTRLFYLLPQAWTDANLPLTLSSAAVKVRVMMGRIELISAHQQATLDQLYESPSQQLYDGLGRFRDALLSHEWRSTSDPIRRAQIENIVRKFGSCSADFTEESR